MLAVPVGGQAWFRLNAEWVLPGVTVVLVFLLAGLVPPEVRPWLVGLALFDLTVSAALIASRTRLRGERHPEALAWVLVRSVLVAWLLLPLSRGWWPVAAALVLVAGLALAVFGTKGKAVLPHIARVNIDGVIMDEKKREEIQKVDTETRLELENKEITEDISVFIKASKFKFKRDMDMFRKLQQLKFTTAPQQQNEIAQIEMSKTSDAIFLEFGFDLSHLVRATNHFNLTENEELKSFQRIAMAQKESEEKAAFEKATPPPETIK